MTRTRWTFLAAAIVFLGTSARTHALTEGQCLFFAEDGRTAICHATGSPNQAFVPLDVPVQACIHHSEHPRDYVAVGDPACQGGGCLPSAAPCDPTLPCCEGLTCNEGTCGPIEETVTTGSPADDASPACSSVAALEAPPVAAHPGSARR